MSVVIETTLGDITVDLFLKQRPRACQNFLKLCKIKYYNWNLFHTVSKGFIAQTGDPTGSRNGGESIYGVLDGPLKRFFGAETNPRIKHTVKGLISFVGNEENMIGSQFFLTLGNDLTYLDEKHCVFGEVVEGLDVLEVIDEAICDSEDRPYQDIRITHTVILDDPFPDLEKMFIPSRSPSPSAERLQGGRIAPDEEVDEIAGKTADEINEMIAEREAKARATILEMVGDLPEADMAPPENVLFVCKLNPVTSDDDLEIIFSRFGKIKSCEVIRDHKTGDSLQYAFIEFEDKKSCEDAYFKMDNVLIDDRRIHVDFSQSVSKVKWMGKGRGVKHFPEGGSLKQLKYSQENNNKNHVQSRKHSWHEQNNMSRYVDNQRYHKESRKKRKSRSQSREHEQNNMSRYDDNQRYHRESRKKRKSRSQSPEYKKSKDRYEMKKFGSRKPRSPSSKNKNIKRNQTKESRSSCRRSRSRSVNRSTKHKKTSRSSPESRSRSLTPKYKKSRRSSSDSSSRSFSPENRKIKKRKSRSISPRDRKKSKRRSSSSEDEVRRYSKKHIKKAEKSRSEKIKYKT
ncbi:peptidyl-prolyl cis-trans isomerase sig-7 isoform X2 [Harmonia axyridis]|uniref:peptidyl-prolyl cis-trans isomerase sig-7 isoform X2 n=1 Tax=Harmonia axyridis TaxID=115357 RepID=UPI001E276894|nr:peptidyl-prolyl cis-trans isomerase sig-7 isoform X2 [Harmonia axyridis]